MKDRSFRTTPLRKWGYEFNQASYKYVVKQEIVRISCLMAAFNCCPEAFD
jgi:hypothetical protein